LPLDLARVCTYLALGDVVLEGSVTKTFFGRVWLVTRDETALLMSLNSLEEVVLCSIASSEKLWSVTAHVLDAHELADGNLALLCAPGNELQIYTRDDGKLCQTISTPPDARHPSCTMVTSRQGELALLHSKLPRWWTITYYGSVYPLCELQSLTGADYDDDVSACSLGFDYWSVGCWPYNVILRFHRGRIVRIEDGGSLDRDWNLVKFVSETKCFMWRPPQLAEFEVVERFDIKLVCQGSITLNPFFYRTKIDLAFRPNNTLILQDHASRAVELLTLAETSPPSRDSRVQFQCPSGKSPGRRLFTHGSNLYLIEREGGEVNNMILHVNESPDRVAAERLVFQTEAEWVLGMVSLRAGLLMVEPTIARLIQ